MLTGKKLGDAIAAAIRLKGVTKSAVAAHFGIRPPSISDWCSRGTIDKAKLPELFAYFSDVVGPAHWGLRQNFVAAEERAAYGPNVEALEKRRDPVISEICLIIESTDDTGRAMALGAIKVALASYRPARKNRRS